MYYNDPCDEWAADVPEPDGFLSVMQEVYQTLCEQTFRPWVRDPIGWQRGLFDRWGEDRVLAYLNRLPPPSIRQFEGKL